MTEHQLQFRVGVFAIVALGIGGAMIFQFGEFQSMFDGSYQVAFHFETAPGLQKGIPVRRYGIKIGTVSNVVIDDNRGGVIAVADIREGVKLRIDSQVKPLSSLLGDVSIEIVPGQSPQILQAGETIDGQSPTDPMNLVYDLEQKMTQSLASMEATSQEWKKVGTNINSLLQSNQGNLHVVLERTAENLNQFSQTMRNANQVLINSNKYISDPKLQTSLREALTALPAMVNETRSTIAAVNKAVGKVSQNLDNLSNVTGPLARQSNSLVTKLDSSQTSLESMLSDMSRFSKLLSKEDGSLNKFATDPKLYQNMNQSAESMAILLKNIEPLIRDMRIFSDKIARHPEILGVSGAMKGSSGIKDPEGKQPLRQSRSPFRPIAN